MWLVPATLALVLVLVASLAWLLPRHRPFDHHARQYPQASPAPPAGPVLASEADREDTAQTLSAAIAEGRLSHEEGADRIGQAYAARHVHELAALTADIPASTRMQAVRRFGAAPALIVLFLLAAAAAGLAAGFITS
jgi:hypothetical protein